MKCSEGYAASIFTSIQKMKVVCHSEPLVSTSSLCSITTQTATNLTSIVGKICELIPMSFHVTKTTAEESGLEDD